MVGVPAIVGRAVDVLWTSSMPGPAPAVSVADPGAALTCVAQRIHSSFLVSADWAPEGISRVPTAILPYALLALIVGAYVFRTGRSVDALAAAAVYVVCVLGAVAGVLGNRVDDRSIDATGRARRSR